MPIGHYKEKNVSNESNNGRTYIPPVADIDFDYMLYVDIIKQTIARTMIRGENLNRVPVVKSFFLHVCNEANCFAFLTASYLKETLAPRYLGVDTGYNDGSTFMLELVFNFKTMFYSDAGITPEIEKKLIEQMVYSRTIVNTGILPNEYSASLPSSDSMYEILNSNKWLLPLAIVNASVPFTTIEEIDLLLSKPAKR